MLEKVMMQKTQQFSKTFVIERPRLSACEVKNNWCLSEKLVTVKKNGVFPFGISLLRFKDNYLQFYIWQMRKVIMLSDVVLRIEGLPAKRAYIAFLADFHFLQDRANFWQTDLFWHEKHRSVIVSVDLRFVLQK